MPADTKIDRMPTWSEAPGLLMPVLVVRRPSVRPYIRLLAVNIFNDSPETVGQIDSKLVLGHWDDL